MTSPLLSLLLSDAPPERRIPQAEPCDRTVSAVFADSREASKHGGSGLFVCIRGASFDGHRFAESVYRAGCRVFAVEEPLQLPKDALQLVYKSTRRALAALSASFYGHPARDLSVVGITGTKGKTTTALVAYEILRATGIPAGYIGTSGIRYADRVLESANTTPESLILQGTMRDMVDCGIRVLLIEVSSQALMLDRVYGIPFHTAVYTNLSPDHIGPNEHPSFEAYKNEKKKLFSDFSVGSIILNRDDPHAAEMLPRQSDVPVSTVSVRSESTEPSPLPPAAVTAERITEGISEDNRPGITFDVVTAQGRRRASLALPGIYNVHNALTALAIAEAVGVPLSESIPALSAVSVPGRCETVRTENGVRIIIDYAHNEASLREILTALRPYTEGRLIALFGSVGGRTKNRRAPMGRIASEYADLVVLTSDNPDKEPPEEILREIRAGFTKETPSVLIPDRMEAIEYALSIAERGDTLLLAGKGHERYQLVNGERLPFSERKIVEELLAPSPSQAH